LVYHVTDIYFEICDQNMTQGATLDNFSMFEQLICGHPNENLRLYIIEHIYGRYKEKLSEKYGDEENL